MSYKARVFKVFVASPSDVTHERNIVYNAIFHWNAINAEDKKIVLLPIGWDISGAPEAGRPAQDYINIDLLDKCDVLIGLFWTRVGTPTKSMESGTIEEILRNISAPKLTMLYFSKKAISPEKINAEQYARLQKFKSEMQSKSFYCEFNDEKELYDKIYDHLQIKVNEGKLRPKYDSDILANIKDDVVLAQEIKNYFPQVSTNLIKKLIYERHSDDVWNALLEKLSAHPHHLIESLSFLVQAGAYNHLLYQEGCVLLSRESQCDFCTFLNDLYSKNKFEFFRLYNSDLLKDKSYREYLQTVIQRDENI